MTRAEVVCTMLIDVARVVLVVVVLLLASWRDVKTREVERLFWVVLSTGAIVLLVVDLVTGGVEPLVLLLPLAVTIATCGGLWLVVSRGISITGKADVLAFFSVGLAWPVHGEFLYPYRFPVLAVVPPFLDVLANTFTLLGTCLAVNAISNLVRVARKDPSWSWIASHGLDRGTTARLLGLFTPVSPGKVTVVSAKLVLHEVIDDDGTPVLGLVDVRASNVAEVNDALSAWCDKGFPAWIEKDVPLLPFILAGFVVTVLAGNVLFRVLELLA